MKSVKQWIRLLIITIALYVISAGVPQMQEIFAMFILILGAEWIVSGIVKPTHR